MRKLFTSTFFVISLIILFVVIGAVLGKYLGNLPNNVQSGLSYGFVAFSVLPITLCLFGLKELNSTFSTVAKYLTKVERARLSKEIDSRIVKTVFIAFFIVGLQVIFAFGLLYFSNGFEYVILGILFGGIFASLVFGIYVCFSVRKASDFCDEIISTKISEERFKIYKESFEDK